MRLERRFSQIGEFIQKAEGTPIISGISGAFKTPLLSAELMKNAEVGRRRWSAIGVDEWIQAGRWWLLKQIPTLHRQIYPARKWPNVELVVND